MTEQLKWYKSLSANQKIELKECADAICGIKWQEFTLLFTPRQRIEILHQKLKIEGFLV